MSLVRWVRQRWSGEADCPEVRRHASEYLEGEASPRLMQRLERHLARCPQCPVFLRTLRATMAALKALPHGVASERLRQRIVREVSGQR